MMAIEPTPQPNLEQLQRWLLAAITHPAGIRAGVLSAGAQQGTSSGLQTVEQVLLPSERMTAEQRLTIYQQAYFARLIAALKEFFPCLADSLGDEVFAQFAVGYVQSYPSQSYTLQRLADRFVQFLQETRPSDAGAADAWTGFWIDLARLELAIDRVFDAPGPEQEPKLTHEQLLSLPAQGWAEAHLQLARGMELLRFEFPVGPYFSSWKQGKTNAVPLPQPSYVALSRRDYVVRRYELTAVQHLLLESLAAGSTVGEAIEAAAEVEADWDALAADLQNWFRQWAAEGFFSQFAGR